MNTQRQSDYLDRLLDGESQCSLPGCSVALEFARGDLDAAAPCHPPCSVAAPRFQVGRDRSEDMSLRSEVIPCTPHYPGGPSACTGQGHCIPNVQPVDARRPTRQDLLQWLAVEGRA
jgi:hypothetical protein